jgi:hypothetical protein
VICLAIQAAIELAVTFMYVDRTALVPAGATDSVNAAI